VEAGVERGRLSTTERTVHGEGAADGLEILVADDEGEVVLLVRPHRVVPRVLVQRGAARDHREHERAPV